MSSLAQQSWLQLLDLTEQMVRAAESHDWNQLTEIQQDREQLMQRLPPASATSATLLETILGLNQQLEALSQQQRQQLSEQLRVGQQNRIGIQAYQQVTGGNH